VNKLGTEPAYQEFRTARLQHHCSGCMRRSIKPGERYCHMVAMPNHDANSTGVPWVLKECLECCNHRQQQAQ
jgi:hypothetical protein